VTADPSAADCDPDWDAIDPAPDRTPTAFDLRQHEMRTQAGQGADRHRLWHAQTIPTQEYL